MNTNNSALCIDNNKSFMRTISSYLCNKYVYLGGFVFSAIAVIIPDLNQDIYYQVSIQKGVFIFLISSSLIIFIAILHTFYNIFEDNVKLKDHLNKMHGNATLPKVRRACPPQLLSPKELAKQLKFSTEKRSLDRTEESHFLHH